MCFLNIKTCQHILLQQLHKIMIFKKAGGGGGGGAVALLFDPF